MASKVDLCNFALGLVAEARIGSIDDSNEPARLCKLHLEQTVREVLRKANWRACRKRAALAASATDPVFGWNKAYPLPVDWLRTVSLNDIDPENVERPLFEVEGTDLLTDETTANIVYIADVTQEAGGAGYARMDALLIRACYTLLASKLAWALQQSRTLRESLLAEFDVIVREAKSVNARDAFEPLVNQRTESGWIAGRFSGTGA